MFVEKLTFSTQSDHQKSVYFLPKNFSTEGSFISVLTGKNGSQKSRVLGELVSAIVSETSSSLVEYASGHPMTSNSQIICLSGSALDRFPVKEIGGRSTEHDSPNYTYIGQRVGINLLSKKRPVESLLHHALCPKKKERRDWPFFREAFSLPKLEPILDLELQRIPFGSKDYPRVTNYFEHFSSLSKNRDEPKKRNGKEVSPATAGFLVENFDRHVFDSLEETLGRKSRFSLSLSSDDQQEAGIDDNVARLGLMCGYLRVGNVSVRPASKGKNYSAFELSSGEFHILTMILALGFTCETDALVLIDEPENSLHPEWQLKFLSIAQGIFQQFSSLHAIISTHSPLILGAVKQGSNVIDMENSDAQRASAADSFGMNSDGILFKNFGVSSSRNPEVIDVITRAVNATELDEGGEAIIVGMRDELKRIKAALPESDPLQEIISALLEDGEPDGSA